MSYRLEFLGISEDEIEDAVNWYNAQKHNQGAEFVLALDNLFEYLIETPLIFPIIHEKMRRATLPNFPYSIIFEIHEPDVILILAVAHQKRNPNRWINR